MRSPSRRELHVRIAIRDRLIRGIIGQLKRHGDSSFAGLVERAAGLIWANDRWLVSSRVGRDIRAFARMDRSRGASPKPNVALQRAAKDAAMTANYLEDEFDGHGGQRTQEDWSAAAQGAWRECFNEAVPLSSDSLTWALRGTRSAQHIALRLTFLKNEPRRISRARSRRRQDRFKDFRKLVVGQKLRAHPWMVGDSKS